MVLTDNIRTIRKAKGLTQVEMSERLGLTKNNYGKVENGQVELTVSRLYKIADILGVSVITLLGENVGNAQQIAELEKENAVLKTELDRANKTLDILLPMAKDTANAIVKIFKATQDYKNNPNSPKEEVDLPEETKQLIKNVVDSVLPKEA